MITALSIAVLSVSIFAQAPATPPATPPPAPTGPQPAKVEPKTPYDSTKAQLMVEKEKNLQLQSNAMTQQYQAFMQQFQGKYQEQEKVLTDWIATVKKDNGWDDTYTYDREKDQWTKAAKVEKPAVKPEDDQRPKKQ